MENNTSEREAQKAFGKISEWAMNVREVASETREAINEFFPNTGALPAESERGALQLFEGWFLMERILTRANVTPLHLYTLFSAEQGMKRAEIDVYERFMREKRFGYFKVEKVLPGAGVKVREPRGGSFEVLDLETSREAAAGNYLVAWLLPFGKEWTMPLFTLLLPSDATYALDRGFAKESGVQTAGFHPREVLELLLPEPRWEREGLPRVRARLSMLLQRWAVPGLTAESVEADFRAAQEKRQSEHPLLDRLLSRAPSQDEAQAALKVLSALWNLTVPVPEKGVVPRGPKELMLIRDLQRLLTLRLPKELPGDRWQTDAMIKQLTDEWFDGPQKELGGRTPRAVILEERKSLGNPREELGLTISPSRFELPGEREAAELVCKAMGHLRGHEAAPALEYLQRAYPVLKGSPQAHRLLGGMATAHIMLGHREEALEMLRAALKTDPDYGAARTNLRLLEGMSPKEFARKHRAGFFKKMQVVKEEP